MVKLPCRTLECAKSLALVSRNGNSWTLCWFLRARTLPDSPPTLVSVEGGDESPVRSREMPPPTLGSFFNPACDLSFLGSSDVQRGNERSYRHLLCVLQGLGLSTTTTPRPPRTTTTTPPSNTPSSVRQGGRDMVESWCHFFTSVTDITDLSIRILYIV